MPELMEMRSVDGGGNNWFSRVKTASLTQTM